MKDLRLYIKICEGCGVLWLRTAASDGVYCRRCLVTLADFPPPNPGKCRNKRIRMAGERAARQSHPRCRRSHSSHTTPNRSGGGVA
jgi:hypothetical protein